MQVMAHNLVAQFANSKLSINTKNKSKSSEKLSSGYRINRSADDAAGLSISEKMREQIRGLNQGHKNIQDGASMLNVADGAMNEMHSILQRMNELAIQASNDTNTDDDRAALDKEISALKKELNHISRSAEFNTQQIFDNDNVMIDINGVPQDLNIYNATYDAATGDVTYGGFTFHGNRIPWNSVDANMVTIDANTNEQIFNEGTYNYTDASGCQFEIVCKQGAKVPEITRKISCVAGGSGITIDGKTISWSALKDEDGNSMTNSNIHPGAWGLEYEGAEISFFIPQEDVSDLDDIIDAINSANTGKIRYKIEENYIGSKEENAVDASFMKNLRISSNIVSMISNNQFSMTVRAGKDDANNENGIWLEDVNGNKVVGSYKTWNELGISSWDEGPDISNKITYTYSDDEGNNDTYLSFDFNLSDVTSVDSVIDGLDRMKISGGNITTHYGADFNINLDKNIVKATAKTNNLVTFDEEKALGRDFDQQTEDNVANANIKYDATTDKIYLDFSGMSAGSVISYEGSTSSASSTLKDDLNTYISYVIQRKKLLALAGKDPQNTSLGSRSLTDLIGTSNITTSGYFDDTITIDKANMKLSDGNNSFQPGKDGEKYPAAHIDFSGLGTDYQLEDLIGMGFNSTCKTCDNHYSIVFTDGASGSTTADGINYNVKVQYPNNTLQIDIRSLQANGVTNGKDLADAIVSVVSECYDFHYTQYASDQNGNLYIYDNRPQNTGARSATFDTAPFQAIDMDELSFSMKTSDGREIDLKYTYNYGDIDSDILVNMTQNNNGEYVKKADGTYEKYNSAKHGNVADSDRYNMDITYKKQSDGSTVASIADMVEDYSKAAMDKMLNNTNIQLNAEDYTYMKVGGITNSNVAIKSVFETNIVMEDDDDLGFHIQASSRKNDAVKIPKFAMNTVYLGVYSAGTKTYEQAQKTISMIGKAIDKLSDKRSLYGAWTNRLEHMSNVVDNTSENTQAAESRIRDADMAGEMMEYSKHSILEQASQAILSQANQNVNGILQLLQ